MIIWHDDTPRVVVSSAMVDDTIAQGKAVQLRAKGSWNGLQQLGVVRRRQVAVKMGVIRILLVRLLDLIKEGERAPETIEPSVSAP